MIQPINKTTQNIKKPRITTYFSAPVTMLPAGERNFCLFNQDKIAFVVSQKEFTLPQLKETLKTSQDEAQIVEALYTLDRLIDNGTKGIPHMYPILARFNDSKSPNIQSFLAGIYRKTQVPDAFGPLISMLIRNSMTVRDTHPTLMTIRPFDHSTVQPSVDPNEEIGGAILEYIRNYSQGPKPIDFSA